MTTKEIFGYEADPRFTKKVAYFSMEFAIDQALKIYSGGLGFLAGSHLRSAYDLKQHLVGVGMLWKYGYYDQTRDSEGLMKPEFVEKQYSFLEDTGIVFTVQVHDSPVHVKAWLLRPETFGAAPLFLLSTDVAENDPVSRSITNNLYDENEATRIAQSIVLGIGGAMLLDLLNYEPEVYHMNEGHSVALNFYLYAKFKSLPEIQKRVVFTTHTPEAAGNESHSYALLKEMSFFYHLQDHEVKFILDIEGDSFNYTLAALKFARKANGVSKIHSKVAQDMWAGNSGICEIIAITNAQHKGYWTDPSLAESSAAGDDVAWLQRKKEMKQDLFKVVSDQCGKLFDPEVLTIVWARRFAGYKRADLIMRDWQRFVDLVSKLDHPVQVIWAGKPYPKDEQSVDLFNKIITRTMDLKKCAVLTGYELGLSALLKKGADVWLNNPTMYREASGTSGMTSAMNGAINLTIPDGWVPEFARDNENCFLIGTAPDNANQEERDRFENVSLLDTLETKVLPTYYERPEQWIKLAETASADVVLSFDSARMATEYYELLY